MKKEVTQSLEHYDLGKVKKSSFLSRGFHSSNYKILSSRGIYVLKILYESRDRAKYITDIHVHLNNKKFRTSKVIKTKEGKNYVLINRTPVAVFSYIDGSILKLDKRSVDVYGKVFGQMHKALSNFHKKNPSNILLITKLQNSYYRKCHPDNQIKKDYKTLKHELKIIKFNKLLKTVIHADSGPDDFKFKNKKFQGMLDFGDSHYDYRLYDIASFCFYFGLWERKNWGLLKLFMKQYEKSMPLNKEEKKALFYFIKIRAIIQETYFSWRVHNNVRPTRNNKNGLRGGKNFLDFLTSLTLRIFIWRSLKFNEEINNRWIKVWALFLFFVFQEKTTRFVKRYILSR